MAHTDAKHDRVDHVPPGLTNRGPPALSHDDTLTETESIISSRQGHHLHKSSKHHADKYEKYSKYNGTYHRLTNKFIKKSKLAIKQIYGFIYF